MQVVEDIEESVLGCRADEVLDVIHDEDVDALVEGDEVNDTVALDGIHILGFEFVTRYVEHDLVLETLLDVDADGLGDVRLAETGTAEEEQRVERGLAGGLGDALAGVHAQFVALPFHQVAEAVHRVQARVDLHAGGPGEDERAGRAGGLVSGNVDRVVGRRGALGCRKDHALAVLHGTDQIEQLGVCADGAADGHAEEILVSPFNVLAEEVGGDLYGELGSVQRNGTDELEPGRILLRIDVVLDDLQAVVPNRNMSFLDSHSGIHL